MKPRQLVLWWRDAGRRVDDPVDGMTEAMKWISDRSAGVKGEVYPWRMKAWITDRGSASPQLNLYHLVEVDDRTNHMLDSQKARDIALSVECYLRLARFYRIERNFFNRNNRLPQIPLHVAQIYFKRKNSSRFWPRELYFSPIPETTEDPPRLSRKRNAVENQQDTQGHIHEFHLEDTDLYMILPSCELHVIS